MLLAAVGTAGAADTAEVMGMRYLRYERCMDKSFGEGFYQRLGIATTVNRWGVAEPTTNSLALQPQSEIGRASCRERVCYAV